MERKVINIAILGLGTIGGATYNNIYKNRELIYQKTGFYLDVIKALEKNPEQFQDNVQSECLVTNDYESILKDENISIVVELMGGTTFAKDCVIKALKAGKHVITANKALIAEHISEINDCVIESEGSFFYEAAVAGGIPIIEAMKSSFVGNKIERVQAIVNGTCNYILTQMEEKSLDFEVVLKDAQEKGFAEADPSFDIEGIDAAHKISILTGLSFGKIVNFDDIKNIEGIKKVDSADINMAKELGYKIKLIASTELSESLVDVRVAPCLINKHHPLASVEGVYNAVFVEGNLVGKTMFYGQGAGGDATSSAVISDIVTCAKDCVLQGVKHLPFYADMEKDCQVCQYGQDVSFYLKFLVKDSPGVLAKIASVLAKHNISIATVTQKSTSTEYVPVFITTHNAGEEDMAMALESIMQIKEEAQIKEAPFVMKILES